MKKNGRPDITIRTTVRRLNVIAKQCDITDPEQVKTILATNDKWQNGYKANIADSYTGFLEFLGRTWKKPIYKRQDKIPYIPTEEELDSLISAAGKKVSTRLQFLKETAARVGEMHRLKWIDIDKQRKLVYIRAEKGSNDRLIPISDKLIAMLFRLPQTNELVFPNTIKATQHTFEALRKRTTVKLANPRLLQIHLHTFRHWKATTEQHKCQDVYHVKQILGHKSVKSTEIYIHIDQMHSNYGTDEYITKVANTPDEIRKLIELGFTKADEIDGLHIYKKRK